MESISLEKLKELGITEDDLNKKNYYYLKYVKLDDIFQVYLKLKEITKKDNPEVYINPDAVDDIALDKLVTFFQEISYRDFFELKIIVKEHDSIRYEDFVKRHGDIIYDPTGTSPSSIEWWEPMLELEDSQLKMLETNKNSEDYKILLEAKELNKVLSNTSKKQYRMQLALLKKKRPDIADRFKRIEPAFKNRFPNNTSFLVKLLNTVFDNNISKFNEKMLFHIFNRLEYCLADKSFKHASNKEYAMKIESCLNN